MAKARPIIGLSPQTSTGLNARMIARVRLEELYSWDHYVALPYAVRELHQLRIAAKRLRYTLEIFQDALPPACQMVIAEVERLQEELGVLHDSDVFIALLRLCLGSWDAGATAHADKLPAKGRMLLNSALLASLLAAEAIPSAEERAGLELLVTDFQTGRAAHYTAFYQHWSQLKDHNFFHEALAILAD